MSDGMSPETATLPSQTEAMTTKRISFTTILDVRIADVTANFELNNLTGSY
jgi:hypothetical protein